MKKLALLIPFALVLLSGCHSWGAGVRIEGGHSHQRAEPMPPAHAPAYGRRRQVHHYYYYPDAEFYFDSGRGLYFYLDSSGGWSFSANLPRHLSVYRHSHYVEFDMDTDKPYSKYSEHKRKYKKQGKHGKPDKRGYKKGRGHDDDDDDKRGRGWGR